MCVILETQFLVNENFYFQCVGLPFRFYRTTCGR